MTTGNTDSSVTLTFRVREQVTPALARMESSLQRVGNTAASTGKFFEQNALKMVAVGSAMVVGARAATDLAVKFGILNEHQGKTASTFIQGAGAVVAMVGGLAQLGTFIASSGLIAALTRLGAAGALVAGGLGAGAIAVGAAGGIVASEAVERGPRAAASRAIRGTSGGATPQTFGGTLPTTLANISINTFAATESELRTAAKTLGRILQEEARIGGFRLP